jgi:hypothetical protein
MFTSRACSPGQTNALVETIDDTLRCVVTNAGLMLQNTPLWQLSLFPTGKANSTVLCRVSCIVCWAPLS